MAVQVDCQAFAGFFVCYRRQHHLIDQLADDIRRSCLRALIGQRLAKLRYLVAVVVGHVGMQEDGIIRSLLDSCLGLRLAVFEVRHLVLDAAGRHAVHQRLHQPVEFPVDFHERGPVNLVPGIALAAQPVRMARVFLAEFIAKRRVHEAALQPLQDGCFERIAADGMAVVAGPLVARVRAADTFGIEDDKPAAAAAAAHKTREEIMRAASVPVA